MLRAGRAGSTLVLPPPPAARTPAPAPPGARCVFVCISDTHGRHDELALPPGDVLCVAGDVTRRGTLPELAAFAAWLRAQPHATKLLVAGNHDTSLDQGARFRGLRPRAAEAARADCAAALELFTCDAAAAAGVRLLRESFVELPLGGWRVWGSALTPPSWGAFQVLGGEAEDAAVWAPLAAAAPHVVLSHGPPRGACDAVAVLGGPRGAARRHVGSAALAAALKTATPPPRAVICGHIHESFGLGWIGGTAVVNVATCDLNYEATRPAVVFALEGGGGGGGERLEFVAPARAALEAWGATHPDAGLRLPPGSARLAQLPEWEA